MRSTTTRLMVLAACLCMLGAAAKTADEVKDVIDAIHGHGASAQIIRVGQKTYANVTILDHRGSCEDALAQLRNIPLKITVDLTLAHLSDACWKHLREATTLNKLILTGRKLEDEELGQIGRLTTLRSLALGMTQFSDERLAELSGLKQLEWLSLAGSSLGDEGLANLQELDGLRVLVLFQTEVSDEAVARLQQALPKVRVLK